MSRYAHLDTDAERLPEGMTLIGYDSDDQSYTYRDTDGSIWKSAPGTRYGKLTCISGPAQPSFSDWYHDRKVRSPSPPAKDKKSTASKVADSLKEATLLATAFVLRKPKDLLERSGSQSSRKKKNLLERIGSQSSRMKKELLERSGSQSSHKKSKDDEESGNVPGM
ncbi:hypothetical protein F4804DRAFT_332929 [Jackrogersella minutella]|nr:hypothetical protein F4804DRAFT_332929 [Jackrogersella minutella]